MKPYVVLDVYKPPKWRAWRVGKDLTNLTEVTGLVPISDPAHRHQVKAAWCSKELVAYVRRRTVSNPRAGSWHQDGDLVPGSKMNDCLVLWTTNTPTEIKSLTGEIYVPKPYEVILFKNLSCYHRRPSECPKVRWLFRQRVEIPGHIWLP